MRFLTNLRKGKFVIVSTAALLFALCRLTEAQERFVVASKDGTQISVQKSGAGPALLLIHGSSVDGSTWQRVLPALDKHFTVYVMDRRGHGHSSDSKVYSISAEADDVIAVTVAIGRPLTLLAHSYGALCALVGLRNLQHVSHLILYEPAPTQDPTLHKNDSVLIEQMDNDLTANRKEEALTFFLKEFAGVPPPAIDLMRASPNWNARVEMAPLLLREVESVSNEHLTNGELERWSVPTAMFIGSNSPQSMKDNANSICLSMRDCQVIILEGQGHLASTSAPDLFVAKVLEAVGDRSSPAVRLNGR